MQGFTPTVCLYSTAAPYSSDICTYMHLWESVTCYNVGPPQTPTPKPARVMNNFLLRASSLAIPTQTLSTRIKMDNEYILTNYLICLCTIHCGIVWWVQSTIHRLLRYNSHTIGLNSHVRQLQYLATCLIDKRVLNRFTCIKVCLQAESSLLYLWSLSPTHFPSCYIMILACQYWDD